MFELESEVLKCLLLTVLLWTRHVFELFIEFFVWLYSWRFRLLGCMKFIFLLQIIATEAFHNYYSRFICENRPSGYRLSTTCYLPVFVVISYQVVGIFLFGLAVTQAVTDICKYSVGRLRPHFLDVCRPNITLTACSSASSGFSVYIDDFTCTGDMGYKYDDSRWVLLLLVDKHCQRTNL